MPWNYRVIRSESGGEITFALHEVYYDEGGTINGWTENAVGLGGFESVMDLLNALEMMAKDVRPAVLRRETSRSVLDLAALESAVVEEQR